MSIFLKKELEETEALCDLKIKEILKIDQEFDEDEILTAKEIRDLQTLVILQNAARKRMGGKEGDVDERD